MFPLKEMNNSHVHEPHAQCLKIKWITLTRISPVMNNYNSGSNNNYLWGWSIAAWTSLSSTLIQENIKYYRVCVQQHRTEDWGSGKMDERKKTRRQFLKEVASAKIGCSWESTYRSLVHHFRQRSRRYCHSDQRKMMYTDHRHTGIQNIELQKAHSSSAKGVWICRYSTGIPSLFRFFYLTPS